MIVDLVRTTTSDSHRLDGAFLAADPAAHDHALDACVFLHGVGGNFYAGNLFEHIGQRFVERGIAVLRVNTRGHDSISITWGATGPVRQGAAYEVVGQCRYDVAAWIRFLQERGFERIGILGHSLGAIKAIYSQAHEPDPAVRAVIACSAPRLSYSAFMNSESQPRFFESMSTARQYIAENRPEALFQASFPFPILITAAGYLDKYGPEERYNVLQFVDRVQAPLLVTYGQIEVEKGGVAFAGMPDAMSGRRRNDQSLSVVTIPRADHVYTGAYEPLSNEILKWLDETAAQS